MGDIPHMDASTTNDFEIKLETNNICSKFLKNHSNLSLKVKKFVGIINELKKRISEKDIEIRNQNNYIDHIHSNLLDSENIRKDLEIQIDILKDELKNEKLPNLENKNNDDSNFTAFTSSFKYECETMSNDFDFDFTDDELPFKFKENEEVDYDEKFRELLSDYFLKRKDNLTFAHKIKDLEKEINFLKQCVGQSEKKLEMQNFIFEDKLKDSQNICFKLEKDLDSQRADFLEKLKDSQCKFLACDKARKDLEKKMDVLTSELENYKSISHQFTNGSQGLDKLLNIGKSSKDRTDLGFDKTSNGPSTSQTTFVRSTSKVETSNSQRKTSPKGQKFQNPRPSVHTSNKDKFSSSQTSSKKFIPICHRCGIVGHIRPKCFKLLNDHSYVQLGAYNRCHVSNSNFQKPSPNMFEKEKAKFYKNRISHQKFVPKCHHCGEIGHIRPKCQKLLKEKASVENSIFKKFDELALEFSKLKNDTFWKPSLNLTNSGKFEKMVWVKKEASKGNAKDKVFDFSKIKILRRPDNPSKLN